MTYLPDADPSASLKCERAWLNGQRWRWRPNELLQLVDLNCPTVGVLPVIGLAAAWGLNRQRLGGQPLEPLVLHALPQHHLQGQVSNSC